VTLGLLGWAVVRLSRSLTPAGLALTAAIATAPLAISALKNAAVAHPEAVQQIKNDLVSIRRNSAAFLEWIRSAMEERSRKAFEASTTTLQSFQMTERTPPTPRIIVDPVNGLFTSEDGDKRAQFSVQLGSRVADGEQIDVTLTVDDPTEAHVVPDRISFIGGEGWFGAREVTVFGKDDLLRDGDVPFVITLAATNGYAPPVTVSGTNKHVPIDLILDRTSGLETDESGKSDKFKVKLSRRVNTPEGTFLEVNLRSTTPSEGDVISPATLRFDKDNWDTEQVVLVQGRPDCVVDPDVPYRVQLRSETELLTEVAATNRNVPNCAAARVDTAIATLLREPTDYEFRGNGAATGPVGSVLHIRRTGSGGDPILDWDCGSWTTLEEFSNYPRACVREEGQPDTTTWTWYSRSVLRVDDVNLGDLVAEVKLFLDVLAEDREPF